jgi:hypothetical protein
VSFGLITYTKAHLSSTYSYIHVIDIASILHPSIITRERPRHSILPSIYLADIRKTIVVYSSIKMELLPIIV